MWKQPKWETNKQNKSRDSVKWKVGSLKKVNKFDKLAERPKKKNDTNYKYKKWERGNHYRQCTKIKMIIKDTTNNM